MVQRAQPIGAALWCGMVASAIILSLTLLPLGAVFWRSEARSGLSAADLAAVRFSVWQALLSALISVALAIPVARALARRVFPGRDVLVLLLGAPFILPVIVAIFGLIAVFGQNGIASQVLGWFGLPPLKIYGLQGILLANVFFNLPLATRLILQGWQSIPAEQFRLAASLGMERSDIHRHLERPMLLTVLPGTLAIIFLICTTSFAVALTLGGGPRATTVELAIYQAFRFDFDLAKAALLASVQFGITLAAAMISLRFTVPQAFGAGLDRPHQRWDGASPMPKAVDAIWITLAAVFLLVPLATIVERGAIGLAALEPQVLRAAFRSVWIALLSTAITLTLALSIALAIQAGRKWRMLSGGFEAVGYLGVALSPLVIGTGLFVLIFPVASPVDVALPVTALVNASMALPFALRILLPAVRDIETAHGRLADSLAMHGFARLRLLVLPRIRRPLGFAAGLAAALSMGDLGVIALFADPRQATLPLEMYRLMASYRMEDAAGAALLLLVLSLGAFWVFDQWGRAGAEA